MIKVSDQTQLVPTSQYKYAKFHFNQFNSVQSRVFEFYNKDCNCVIGASTSVGKTVCAEMIMAYEVRENKKKALYLAPLKALAQEKADDWQKNHFSDLKVAICTGDYKATQARKKELEEADILIMTSEMLNSKSRNYRSENNTFLDGIGCVVADEFHLLSTKGRGDHIESGIMKFTESNKDARIIGLSATLPNVYEIGSWLECLNGKQTYVLNSTYRPCPLFVHYRKYKDVQWGYDANEKAKIREALNIMDEHMQDKFLLFVHTKRTGELLFQTLKEQGIRCEYHNADLPKEKRADIERRFREDPRLRCVVATSTLSAGVNLPARRVIVLGLHRGISLVEVGDINQACGRAGRPQYDPQGDSYVIIPASKFEEHKARLQNQEPIKSQMLDSKCLSFHLTSEVHHRNIKDMDGVKTWYERSLAHHQNQSLNEDAVNQVVENLTKCGALMHENDTYDVTVVGMVASMFYYSPFDVSDMIRNWNKVFEAGKHNDDFWISMALGNTDSNRSNITSNADKEEMAKFCNKLGETTCEKVMAKKFMDGALKAGCCYYYLLKGYNSQGLGTTMRGLQMDAERMCEVLATYDQMTGRWGMPEYFKRLYLRMLYGVEEEMVDVCQLKGIGKVKVKRLWDANLRSLESIAKDTLAVMKAINCSKKVAEDICRNAKELLLTQ